MHKLYLSKNSEYTKFITSLSQDKLQKSDVDCFTFNDFATQYKEIQDAAFTISLFDREKCIIIENCQFLTANHSISDEAMQVFEQLITHKPTHLIMTVQNDKLDERKKITKMLHKTIEVSVLKDDSQTANQLLQAYLKQENIIFPAQISQQLLVQSNQNIFHSISQIKRFIIQYKTNDFTNITIPEIQQIPDEDIFFLGEYITNNDYKTLLKKLNEWITLHPNQADFQRVMRYLFNHAKLIYEVYNLANKHYSYSDIGKLLKVHEYRVKLLMPRIKNIQEELLVTFLNAVVEGDYMMKTGVMNRMLYIESQFLNV